MFRAGAPTAATAIESRIYHHWKIRNGKVAYIYGTTDRSEALGSRLTGG